MDDSKEIAQSCVLSRTHHRKTLPVLNARQEGKESKQFSALEPDWVSPSWVDLLVVVRGRGSSVWASADGFEVASPPGNRGSNLMPGWTEGVAEHTIPHRSDGLLYDNNFAALE